MPIKAFDDHPAEAAIRSSTHDYVSWYDLPAPRSPEISHWNPRNSNPLQVDNDLHHNDLRFGNF